MIENLFNIPAGNIALAALFLLIALCAYVTGLVVGRRTSGPEWYRR